MEPKDEIKQKTDIAELIGEYLTLKPSGTDGFKALCPFHNEKSGSFHVSTDRQIWHCFGCGEGGDCFSFVQKMEGMTFPEVLVHLGKKVGVEVKRFSSKEGNQRARLLAINDLASKFYVKVLADSPSAEVARDYIEGRGIDAELMNKFRLGFAPDTWDSISKFLIGRGYSETEIVQAGLGMKKKSGIGIIDRFRNRIMVTLSDHHGNVVGFTGRVLDDGNPPLSPLGNGGNSGPKYMNSPQTPVYHKGQLLYGLDLAKTAVKKQGYAIVTEGNLDVIASHKAGVENVVASSGTALTEDQLALLSRYTKTIVFAFDQDAAGLIAAKRGIAIARSLNFDVRAAILPTSAKDPDDLVQQDPKSWKQVTESSVPIMQYLIAQVSLGKDLNNIDDKRAIAAELVPPLGQMQNVVEREHWLQVVADLMSVDIAVLRSSLPQVKAVDKPSSKSAQVEKKEMISREHKAFYVLLGSFVNNPEQSNEVWVQLSETSAPNQLARSLYKKIGSSYDPTVNPAQKSFFARLRVQLESETNTEDLIRLLDKSSLLAEHTFQHVPPNKVLEHLKNLLQLIQSKGLKEQRKALAIKLRQAESASDSETVQKLMQELNELK